MGLLFRRQRQQPQIALQNLHLFVNTVYIYIYKAPLGKTHIGWLFIVSSAVIIPVSLLKLLKFVG